MCQVPLPTEIYGSLLERMRAVPDQLPPEHADLVTLLRVATSDLEKCAGPTLLEADILQLQLTFTRCAQAETALLLAVQEARRRRVITSEEFQRLRGELDAVRRQRSDAFGALASAATTRAIGDLQAPAQASGPKGAARSFHPGGQP